MLVPIAHSTPKAGKIDRRRVDNRLDGVDLYVVRQAWKHHPGKKNTLTDSKEGEEVSSLCSNFASMSPVDCAPIKPLSLHDEILCKFPRSPKIGSEGSSQSEPPLLATSSRPCYRCISYMQWAGIRRLFWSNQDGEWEGDKVRDLVDALGLDEASWGASDETSASMLVTKHEILMLRRQMGENQASKTLTEVPCKQD
jgi:hypothetical protein